MDSLAPRIAASSLVSCYRARFHDCDPNGFVNNSVLMGFLEQSGMDYLSAGGWPMSRTKLQLESVFVARRHQIDFHQPASENDMLMVSAWGVEMGGSRAAIRFEVRRVSGDPFDPPPTRLVSGPERATPPNSDLIASGHSVYTFTDMVRRRPTRIPDEIVDAFFLPPSVDHRHAPAVGETVAAG
jgi:YbgC/YbaW family acyl-CoA thioester hydrolase